MPKFRNLKAALAEHATNERDYSQMYGWSGDTRCPGYAEKPGNPSWGQCVVARDAFCARITALSSYADLLFQLERTGCSIESVGELDELSSYFFHAGNTSKRDYLRLWRELIGDWQVVCVYGGGITQTGQVFGDHCWTQVVPPGHVGDASSGIIVDTTLDQFSSELPKVHVQEAGATDSPVTYRPEHFALFTEHDTTARLTMERVEIYLSVLQTDPLLLWGVRGNLTD